LIDDKEEKENTKSKHNKQSPSEVGEERICIRRLKEGDVEEVHHERETREDVSEAAEFQEHKHSETETDDEPPHLFFHTTYSTTQLFGIAEAPEE